MNHTQTFNILGRSGHMVSRSWKNHALQSKISYFQVSDSIKFVFKIFSSKMFSNLNLFL